MNDLSKKTVLKKPFAVPSLEVHTILQLHPYMLPEIDRLSAVTESPMSTSILEQQRALHEDLERYERVMCDIYKEKPLTVCCASFLVVVSILHVSPKTKCYSSSISATCSTVCRIAQRGY